MKWVNIEEAKRGPLPWLGYVCFQVFLGIFRALPLAISSRFAAWLSRGIIRLLGKRRREFMSHLQRLYGDRAPDIARANANHYGYMLAEIAHTETIRRHSETWFTYEGTEHYESVCEQGVLVITGHISNWEIIMMGHHQRYGTGHVPVKRVHNHYLNEWITAHRDSLGLQTHDDRGSGSSLLKAARTGGTICFLADQNTPDTDAVWVPFLGQEAATRVGPALLAIRGKIPVITMRAVRTQPGHFTIIYGPQLPMPDPQLPLRQQLYQATTTFNREIGAMIDCAPEQWLWLHRRWKRPRPPLDDLPAGDHWRIGDFNA